MKVHGSIDLARRGAALRVGAAFTIALLVACGSASAQTAVDDLPNRVKQGQKVSVTDEHGRTVRGRIVDMTPDSLAIARGDGREEVQYARIVSIDTVDELRNGALIGLGIGLGFFMVDAALAASDGLTLNAAGYVLLGGVYAGLGAGAGAGIDALIGGNRNVYQRGRGARLSIAPSFGRDRLGAAIGISW
jgi:hypothetical protein